MRLVSWEKGIALSITEFFEDGLGQLLVNFGVARHGLRLLGFWIGVPVMPPAMSYQHTAHKLKLLDEVAPFHLGDQ